MVEVGFTFIGSSMEALTQLCLDIAEQTGVRARAIPLSPVTARLTLSALTRHELEAAEAYLTEHASADHYFLRINPRPK